MELGSNDVEFDRCQFLDNTAFFGGGFAVIFSQFNGANSIAFTGCTWKNNSAYYGAAVDISSQRMSKSSTTKVQRVENSFNIRDVTFESNTLCLASQVQNETLETKKKLGPGKGTLLVAGRDILFGGQVYFYNNTGTAIYAMSSVLQFNAGTNATFVKNSGFYGGAVSLIGYSALHVGNNVIVNMTNNQAAILVVLYTKRLLTSMIISTPKTALFNHQKIIIAEKCDFTLWEMLHMVVPTTLTQKPSTVQAMTSL